MQPQQIESKRGHQEIQTRDHTKTIMAAESEKLRRTQKLGQNRLVTLLDKQAREIHNHEYIIERIEEFSTELYVREQITIIHTDPKEVPHITEALRDMKSGTATGNDHNYQYRHIESRTRYYLDDSC